MANLVEHSVSIVWDGIKEYETYKDEYDLMGAQHDMSGIDWCLTHILCQGDRFCHHAEATVNKIFGFKDSPSTNSLHDSEIHHSLFGDATNETRCIQRGTSTSYSSEIGGGGRSATKRTEASGGKRFRYAHDRTMHKLLHTTYFSFFDLKYMPWGRISVIKSSVIIDLWEKGIYAIQKGEHKGFLPQAIGRGRFYYIFYGCKNSKHISWKYKNPWGISSQRQKENIEFFNNELGYEETLKRLGIESYKKINIDEEISQNYDLYDIPEEVREEVIFEDFVKAGTMLH